MMYRLGSMVALRVGGKTIVARLDGVDTYSLENMAEQTVTWPSYTLTSKHTAPFKRFWFTDWGKDGCWLWLATKRVQPNKAWTLVMQRSGLASLTFKGDKGKSTPHAALIVFKNSKGELYGIERFGNSDVMTFKGRRIAKPKSVR